MKKKFILFCLAGGIGVITEIIFFNLFYFYYPFFAFAKAASLSIALSLNFFINRNVTFLAKSEQKRKQVPRYIIVYAIAISINFLVSMIMSNFLDGSIISENLSTISGILAALPITFFGSQYFIFRRY